MNILFKANKNVNVSKICRIKSWISVESEFLLLKKVDTSFSLKELGRVVAKHWQTF